MNKGALGEKLACQYLQKQGLILLEKNFRLRFAEIDLIMRDQEILVFIEVKYRSSDYYGSTVEQVTPGKQRKIKLAASAYLQHLRPVPCVRFDVVGVCPSKPGYRFNWVKGAFE